MAIKDSKYVTGPEKLKRRIEHIKATLAVPVLTEAVGQLLLKRTRERFDREVTAQGKPWADLKPDTIKKKRKMGASNPFKKLVLKGELRSSIQIIRGALAAGESLFINTGAGMRIGVKGDEEVIAKARVHQRGYKARNIPARPFLGIGDLDVRSVDTFMRRRAQKVVEPLS